MAAPNTTNNVTVRKLVNVAEGMWNKSKNAFVNASGDTMTGRLTLENAPINQIVTGTGTAATSSSSGGTTTYYPAKWNFDLGIATPSAGDQLVIKIPVAGHDYGTFMSTDNGTTYYPVAQSTGSTRFTTRYPVNAYVFIVFEEYTGSANCGQVDYCFAVAGSTGRSAYKVGCWRVVNDYDSGNTYDRLYTANGRFRTGTTGCYPYSLVCLDNTDSYSTLVTSNPGTGVNKSVNTDGKFVFPASILYYAADNTTAAGTLVSSSYVTYLSYPSVDVRYSSNHTVTFTTHKPVYIECTLNGDGTWSPTAVQITQTLRDGYYYIFLGLSYSTEYQLSLAPTHPMYYCADGKLVSAEVARGDITAGTNNGELNVAGTDITVYTHPTDAGNKHIPAGGSSGQFLGWDSDGTAKWVANPNVDTKVKATAKSDNVNYKILATASASPTSGAATEAVYDTDITLNPSTNTISANVSGTAASAGKLTTARTTYVTLGTASTSTTRDWSGTTTIPVSGTLGLGNGGTGATSAAGARTNLDVYSKSETESLLNGKVVIVTVLPATGEAGKTYYVKDTSSPGVDKYDEYIWAVDAGATTESWIHVGEKSLDLSEYVNSLTTSGTGPLVKSLSKSGNELTATLGTIAIDNLSDWASSADVTVSSVTYHTWWPVAPTSSNQVYGLSIYNGRLFRIYNNKGTYSAQAYDVNTTYTNKSLGQGYGTCATDASTAAKIVSMSDYALTTGGIVTVKFTNALCTSATMNINGKGAKPIYIKGAAVTANNAATVSAGDTAYFMYDGTAYHLLGTDRAATNPIVNISRSGTTFTATRLDGTTFTFTQQDNNTTYTQEKLGQGYGTCTTAEATAAKSVTLTGYELEPNGVVAVKFTNGLCASATMSINGKTATPIYINGAAVSSTSCKEVLAGDLAFFIYDGSHYQFICTDRISKNGITGLSISGRTITYTRADGTTGTLTTQDTTYSFDGEYNASTNKVATVSTVTNAVNALDVDDITGFGAGQTLATLTETDGKIAATFQDISITKSQVSDFSHAHGNITNDGKVGTTADYAVVTTTGGAVTATSLATSSPSTSGNTLEFIDTVSQNSKGKISATKKKVTIDDTYSSTGTNPVSGKAIAAAIETLDVTEVGGDGKYIKKIKEDNGKISATVETMDTTPTASSTKAVTSGGIKTALDAKVPGKALSVSVPASSKRYVKMVVPSGYHHYLVFFNASLADLHAEWLFRSYGDGGTTRTVVNYIGALVAARKWYVAGSSGKTFYIEFANNTTGSQTVNFKVCALDISALPTLTVESEVPSGYVEQPVVGTVASQLLTARKLAVSLSNTSTDTTFNGSANVTNIKVGGTLGVANGGTGKVSVTANNFLVGNGTDALVEKTPSEVRTLIGAGTSSLTIGTSSTQAAAGDHKHGTMHSSFRCTVPDQSSDTTWETNIGLENNGFWLKSLRMQNNAPNWLVNNFGAGIAFGGADTKGVISLAYDNTAQVRFAGGNGQSPNWYWTLKGSPGKTYTLPSDTCTLQAAFSIKKNGATITPSDGEANIGYMPVTGTLETSTVQGAIQALRVNPGGKMGSVQLSASTVDSTSIPAAWYNYIWIPHRTGAAEADNQNFGTLILTPMASTPEVYVIEGSALNTSSPTYRISTLQAALPTSGTASTTYAINVGGNAATATTATNFNASSGTIKTALEGKANWKHWTAFTKGQTWSRLFYCVSSNPAEGSSGILAVSCTREDVVCNATFLITTSHSGATKSSIIELASCDYTQVRSRIVVNRNGNYYFEVYDTAQSIAPSTTQRWHCTFLPLLGANLTTYTEFTDGTTIPSGYTATNDFTTTGGNAAAAIKNITRSGTTFTATRQDGSTFTFTQQDSNTDTKVKATAKTDNANYKILATASASPTSASATEAVYSPNIALNPSTNTISANITGYAYGLNNSNVIEHQGNKDTYPLHRIASYPDSLVTTQSPYADNSLILHLFSKGYSYSDYGIVMITVKIPSTVDNTHPPTINISWKLRSSGIPADAVQAVCIYSDGLWHVDVFFRIQHQYQLTVFNKLGSNGGWALYSSTDASGGTEIYSAYSGTENTAASKKLYNLPSYDSAANQRGDDSIVGTAITATTASNFDTSGGTIKSSLNAKVNIASDGVVATSNSHWDIIMQVATIASNGVHYKRWLCKSDGTSAFVDYRPNSDNASFMLEAYAVKWNSYEDCKYKLLYWRAGKQTPYVAELIFNSAQGFPETITWYDTGAADTKVKATAKTNNANYKILATASASPTSGSATEAVYDTDITLNPSTNTISANITGDAQTVRGLYITKTIVNDANAIIFF